MPLRHDEALALAASCAPLVHAARARDVVVRLSLDETRLSWALPWIEIVLPAVMIPDVLDHVAQLRGVIDVLGTLAQCAGCAPTANTQLWEELLYVAGVGLGGPRPTPVWFDSPFPRLRLVFAPTTGTLDTDPHARQHEAEWIASVLQVVARLGPQRDQMVTHEAVEAAMVRLAPFVRDSNPRPLALGLALPSVDTQWLLPAVVCFTQDLATASLPVGVQEVSLEQSRFQSVDPLDTVRWLEELPLVESIVRWTLDDEIDDHAVYARHYRKILGLDNGNGGRAGTMIETLSIVLPNVTEHQFVALCSGLPFARRVRRLHISKDSDWEWDVLSSAKEWAWLGYAVFHMHSEASTWIELIIDGCAFEEHSVGVFCALQRGDISALGHNIDIVPADSIGYGHEEDTISASELSDYLYDHNNQFSFSHQSCLTTFRASPNGLTASGIEGLQSIIRSLGPSLTTLELGTDRSLPSQDVAKIFSSCPVLTSIAFDHDGTYWVDQITRHGATAYPHLTSIRQTCSLIEAFGTTTALTTLYQLPIQPFPALRVLHFAVTKACAVFPQIASALGIVLNSYASIECFAMVKVRHGITARSYAASTPSERRAKLLCRLGLAPTYIDWPSEREAVRHQKLLQLVMEPLRVTREMPLPAEIIAKIIVFVGGGHKRHLCIDLV